ncbi:MFS transporter [Rhizobium sp. SL86]|uniref:MFS transporter n=1 Tax=Rhizobium sp. SL86 TaxID=2995148 RepID=UPI002275FDE5|nr:MFS transporter [Rhizobium sp. SL86]MCY1667363.1 MFS transporter [Rhizobium sp. SL86]
MLALLMACGFLVVGQLYVTIPLVRGIASRFAVDPARASLSGTAFGLAYAAGFLIFGPLSDRYGRKRMILIGLVGTTLATALVGMASGFGFLLLARAVQGLAASIFPPSALSLVTEDLPAQHRPLGVSLMSFAFLGAAPLAQLFAAGSNGELPAIMFQLAPLYAVGALGLAFTASSKRTTSAPQNDAQAARPAGLLRDPGIVAAWLAAVTVLLGFVSFYSGAQILGATIGVDLQTLRLVGLPPLLFTFAAAPLTRRYGATVTARLGLILAAAALGIAAIATPSAALLASAFLSGGVALAVPGLIATVAGRTTNANRGRALAIYSFALFVGASTAPPIAQALAGLGAAPLWLLSAVLLLLAALGLTFGISRPSSSSPR